MKFRGQRVSSLLLVVGVLAGCGGADPVPPPPEADSGADAESRDAALPDGAMVDAGRIDAAACPDGDGDGHGAVPCGDDCDDSDASRYPGNVEVCDSDDEDCDDSTYGGDADADSDGFASVTCCNGVDNCGADCDDALSTVSPSAAEVCNAGVDDDCDGLGDSADGVCVPCAAGYTGFDGDCTNVDECATSDFCGTGSTACTDVPGTFACSCAPGYRTATPVGALCQNIDECAAASNPCGSGTCADNAGSYVCTCPSGTRLAMVPSITCTDIDECAEGSDLCTDVPVAVCVNTVGNYVCTCPAGYTGPARGAGGCLDVDECVLGLDDCDDVVGICTNTGGSFGCACPVGFVGTARGAASCRWDDASLVGLTFGAGTTLSPSFSPSTPTYVLTLAPGATSTSVTATVTQPTRTAITLAGSVIGSGVGTPMSVTGFAPRAIDVVVTTETGRTRIYTIVVRRGPTYVKASITGAGDVLGTSVSLSADGTRLAVGAYHEDSLARGIGGNQSDNGASDSGAAYVFARMGATWVQEAYVKASNTQAFDSFGYSVSLSADGTRLAVGAPVEDSNATGVNGDEANNASFDAGAVYVFSRSGTAWAQEAYVKASNTGSFDSFGYSVCLSADGSQLAVGAYQEDSSATGVNGDQFDNATAQSGAAYVFSRSGTTWTQDAYVKASNTGGSDFFGYAVALSADGTRLAVGAYQEDSSATGVNGDQTDNSTGFSGAVYVFSRSGTTWTQEAYLKASNTGAGDGFGIALSFSADGTTLVVGAIYEDSSATGIDGNQADNSAAFSGAVYVFTRSAATWVQSAYVKASNTGASDVFGVSLSLSADGTRLVVGSRYEDSSATGIAGDQTNNGAGDSGAVYVFSRSGTAWSQEAYVKAPTTGGGDEFGISVCFSADGGILAVGAAGEDSSATGIDGNQVDNGALESGAAYVY